MQLALDFGNVLCKLNFNTYFSKLVEYNIATTLDGAKLFSEELQPRLDLGNSNIEKELKEKTRFLTKDFLNLCISDLVNTWTHNICEPVPEIDSILENIINYGHEVAILSNIGHDHFPFIRKFLPKSYDRCIKHFSFEVGARKPTKLYYQSFLLLNPSFKDCLYLDDRHENVNTGNYFFKDSMYFALSDYNNNNEGAYKFKELLYKYYYF